MLLDVNVSSVVNNIFQQGKLFAGFVGVLWASFTAFNWVKDIRYKDLRGIKEDVNGVRGDVGTLSTDINSQTDVIAKGFASLQEATVREVGELRSDFRAFYTAPDPIMIPVRARGSRKRASTAVRIKAKAKPRSKAKPIKTVKKAK